MSVSIERCCKDSSSRNELMAFDYDNHLFCEESIIEAGTKNLVGLKLMRFLAAVKPLSPRSRILDIACGVGTFTGFIKPVRKDCTAIGVDISQKALLIARQKYQNVHFVQADIVKLPYTDSSFDMVCGFDVLEHINEIDAVFREIVRVLKSGGCIHFHVPCEGQPFSLWWLLWKLKCGGNIKRVYAGHIQRFTFNDIKKIIESHGFEISEIKYSYHFTGQILDLVQWLAAAMRRSISEENAHIPGHRAMSNLKKERGNIVMKVYQSIIRILEVVSFYESKLLSNLNIAMSVDVTAVKLN